MPNKSLEKLTIVWKVGDDVQKRVISVAGATAAALCGIALNVEPAKAQTATVNGLNCEVKYPNSPTYVVQSVPPTHCTTGLVNSDGSYNRELVTQAQAALAQYLKDEAAQQAAAQPTPTQAPTPVPEANPSLPSAEVIAAETAIAKNNQVVGQTSAQQPNNQGEFVQAVVTPLAVNAQPTQAEDGADKGFFELLFGSNCQATLEKYDCDYGSDSENNSASTSSTITETPQPTTVASEASTSSTQADSTQPTAGTSETALKLDSVDVKPGQALGYFANQSVPFLSAGAIGLGVTAVGYVIYWIASGRKKHHD